MLVLSRRKGERIVLPECGVSLQVLSVGNKTIRLGISAPAAIKIQREELRDHVAVPRPRRPLPPS